MPDRKVGNLVLPNALPRSAEGHFLKRDRIRVSLKISRLQLQSGQRCQSGGFSPQNTRPQANRPTTGAQAKRQFLITPAAFRPDEKMNGRRNRLNRGKRLTTGRKNPPRSLLYKIIRKALYRSDERQAVASALFAGGDHDLPPVFAFFVGALTSQTQHRARSLHGNDTGSPKLHCLLDDPIHLVAACQRLHQHDIERRLPAHLLPLAVDGHRQARANVEPRMQFTSASVEQHYGLTTPQAQNFQGVMCDRRRKFNFFHTR